MNSNRMNPIWGSGASDNAAAIVMEDLNGIDDDLAGYAFAPFGNLSYTSETTTTDLMETLLGISSENTDDKKLVTGGKFQFADIPHNHNITVQEEVVKRENIIPDDIENRIENFNRTYDEYEFHIEESERPRNKPYEVEDNCIVAKRDQAIKIKAVGAQNGHTVKMSMRFKEETHYQHPVLACKMHKNDMKPSPSSSFYVVPKTPIKYVTEDDHVTAIMTVPILLEESFCFSSVFRCWNSCNKSFGRGQEMILKLCDSRTGDVLHMASFDIRVCENVGRDSQMYIKQEKKGVKRLKRSTVKKPSRQRIKNEAKPCEELQEGVMDQASALVASPPCSRTRFYMVELDDDLYPVLDALVKVRGKKLVEVDPVSLPGSNA